MNLQYSVVLCVAATEVSTVNVTPSIHVTVSAITPYIHIAVSIVIPCVHIAARAVFKPYKNVGVLCLGALIRFGQDWSCIPPDLIWVFLLLLLLFLFLFLVGFFFYITSRDSICFLLRRNVCVKLSVNHFSLCV